VWQSPIGLLIHRQHGLWHAYRGAFLFDDVVIGLPAIGAAVSPCVSCIEQPCLSACPVDAFSSERYDSATCAAHVRSDTEPDCLHRGCAARLACPVGTDSVYGVDQMEFHMRAFVGIPV
jgi:epoxyqueuosine reductase QueG